MYQRGQRFNYGNLWKLNRPNENIGGHCVECIAGEQLHGMFVMWSSQGYYFFLSSHKTSLQMIYFFFPSRVQIPYAD